MVEMFMPQRRHIHTVCRCLRMNAWVEVTVGVRGEHRHLYHPSTVGRALHILA